MVAARKIALISIATFAGANQPIGADEDRAPSHLLPLKRGRGSIFRPEAVALIFAVVAWAWSVLGVNQVAAQDHPPGVTIPRFSIVALPFDSLSANPAEDSFADALTNEVRSSVARLSGVTMIAYNAAVTDKSKPVDARAIGRELGVRYALEGSVQSTNDQVRVSAHLSDAESGAHLWADQFNAPGGASLQARKMTAARIARAIYLQLPEIVTARRKRTPEPTPDAEDLALECQANVIKIEIVFIRPDPPCEQALAADPDNVRAMTWSVFRLLPSLGRGHERGDDLKAADALLSKALALDPNYAPAHLAKAYVLQSQFRLDDAMAEDRRAIELDSSLADAYWHLGILLRRVGDYQTSLELIDEAIWLSPHDPFLFLWYAEKASGHLALKQYNEAIDSARRAIAINPNRGTPYLYLIVGLALSGDEARTHEALQGYLATPGGPNKTLADWRKTKARYVNEQVNPRYLEYWDLLFEGLRKAGVPEE